MSEHKSNHHGERRTRPAFSVVLGDGRLVEAVYRPEDRRTAFRVWQDGAGNEETAVKVDGETFVPYSAANNLLQHGVVLLPSVPAEYGSRQELVQEIQAFIHRYVDVSPVFERLTVYYVLMTWLYDRFNELPYLRVRGDPGSGKTRFLQTVGSICFKPIFASGASTVSPIFRILDVVQGTLVMDESDFRFSDERTEIVKILNNGNAKGFPVLRSELVNRMEYDPRAYTVFGPKIVATRSFFQDRALESRCLTEDMGRSRIRRGIPITLPPAFQDEALVLRNKLLTFRFQNYGRQLVGKFDVDEAVEPRMNQVFGPLLALIDDEAAAADLSRLMRQLDRQQVADRGMEVEAQVLEVVRGLLDGGNNRLSVNDVAQAFAERFGDQYERRVSARWMGGILRRRLLLKTEKNQGLYVIPPSEEPVLQRLFERYGISKHPGCAGDTAPADRGQRPLPPLPPES